MTAAIVVPIKAPWRAKQRLGDILTEAERRRLAHAMAADVLAVVSALQGVARYAVSDDPELQALARRAGLEVVIDREGAGQSAAVRQGFQAAAQAGAATLVTIPGDVPAVTGEDLRRLLEAHPEVDVLIAPDRDGVGTNGLRLRSPHAIPLHFGDDSLRQHREEAARAGLRFAVLPLERLACDLDRPEDLAAYLRLRPRTATLALLEALAIEERLAARDRPHA
ncbi:MAG TPA: 2-phospho-L-lactate guanylyltransferase [Candidatus Limnocylindrales bacterium]|nr:2-phospho-L-lactate guanylyltransferase [Candidatus Limnocylindrales bacterium]